MGKLFVSIYKETLLLLRDIEGVVLLFLMPLFLVIIVALLQHRSFQNIMEAKIPVIIVDFDNDTLGITFRKGIKASDIFEVTEVTVKDKKLLEKARKDVANGVYQIGIFIPENSTRAIRDQVSMLVEKQLPLAFQFGMKKTNKQAVVKLFFDPITKSSFRDLIKSKLNEFVAQTETRIVYKTYSKVVDALTQKTTNIAYPEEPIIQFDEDFVSEYSAGIIPNAVQHNVPAWTLFGMFLICIPIAGNIIKERSDGCLARLKTIPVSYFTIMTGKSIVFITICLIQAALIVVVGIFFMPLIDLPRLQINNNWGALFFITLASAFAASGYGVAIGTIATSHVQAATFGSVSTVILAAIGGVWIPVMLMSDVMRKVSEISPMNWGLHGYNDVFLRNAGTLDILPDITKLFLFYLICTIISLIFRKYQEVR